MTATATSNNTINTINHAHSDDPVITMMEDDAYLMSMVDTDSLLPSNMTFGGMFEAAAVGGGGESIHPGGQLNAEELTGTSLSFVLCSFLLVVVVVSVTTTTTTHHHGG